MSPAQRAEPISPKLQTEAACTEATGVDMLRDLMAPVEDGRGEEEEIEIQDEIQDEEAEQDAEPFRVARDPKLPSQEDVECHRCSHIPFREWCRHCVHGRGRGDPHLRTAGSTIPVVGLDCFFIQEDKVKKRTELE